MILCSDNGAEQTSFVAATQTPIKEIRQWIEVID